jgi:hypothetical protein
MIDANQRWDLPTASRAIRALSAFDLAWVEEPLVSDDLHALTRLRADVAVPIAVGENLYTAYHTAAARRRCLRHRAAQRGARRRHHAVPAHRSAGEGRQRRRGATPAPGAVRQLALCLPTARWVEDVEDSSFAALGHSPLPAAYASNRPA